MAQTPGDKTEPSLELPPLKLPGFGRRKKARSQKADDAGSEASTSAEVTAPEAEPAAAAAPLEDPTPADVPLGEPSPAPPPQPEATQQMPLEPEPEPESAPVLNGTPRRRAKRERSGLSLPTVPGRVAAAVTGLVVGVVGGAATWAAMAGCEAVRGVSTCGGAPGFFILVAIVVLMILLGTLLLKAFKVGDPGSTSFLAVGVVTVVAMLTLLDVILSPWMFVVIPVLSAAAYLLAHWVTTRFDSEQTGRRDWT
ncbi:MAG TPA: hypothetical protein VK204_15000 [Nocardioidaceae bacterium]|nr:hypothetical protein [Nocardioidaceae bacterium]